MTDKSSCSIYELKAALGHLCHAHCSRTQPNVWSLSWSHHCYICYLLCLPSVTQFLVTLVICWRIYCLPYHIMVLFQHFLMMKTSSFDDSTSGFTFIIGEFLCFSCRLSPIDWQTVESFPCSTSAYIYSHGLDCTSSLGLFMKTLVPHLWTKLRKIMFHLCTQLPDLWRLIIIVYCGRDPPL